MRYGNKDFEKTVLTVWGGIECKPMSFAGTQEPTAFVELKSLGLNDMQTKDLSLKLCSFLEETLKIDSSRIYIEFSNPERAMFGWNKSTF